MAQQVIHVGHYRDICPDPLLLDRKGLPKATPLPKCEDSWFVELGLSKGLGIENSCRTWFLDAIL